MLDSNIIFIITISICVIVAVSVAFIVYLYIKNKGKKNTVKEHELINADFYAFLGGTTNIESAEFEGDRIAIKLKDISSCNLDGLKDYLGVGVFVTDTTVKFRLKNEAESIVNTINNDIK